MLNSKFSSSLTQTSVSEAVESLRSYSALVRQAVQFLRTTEVALLPPYGSVGPCSRRLQETQQALDSLQNHFQTYVEQIQQQVELHPCLCPQKMQELQEHILSQLLVRMSTLQAKGHMQLDTLSRYDSQDQQHRVRIPRKLEISKTKLLPRCSENEEKYSQRHDDIILSVKSLENSLSQVIHQKVTSLAECRDQHDKLRVRTKTRPGRMFSKIKYLK